MFETIYFIEDIYKYLSKRMGNCLSDIWAYIFAEYGMDIVKYIGLTKSK